MIETLFDVIQHFWLDIQQGQLPDLGGWNYMLMALFIMVQGRASAVLGGIAAAAGHLNLGLIILVALLARVTVDLFWYKVGSTGYGDRIGRRIGPYERYAGRVQGEIRERPIRFVLLAKLSGGLSILAVTAVGNARVPFRRWLPASLAGEFLSTQPLLLLAFFATDTVSGLEGSLSYVTIGLTAAVVLIFILKAIRSKWVAADRQP